MGLLNFFLGWNRRVRRLRKRWDRRREDSLKKKGYLRRMLLEKLDAIENNLRIIEERRLSRVDRARLAKSIEIDLEEVKAMLKSRPEELRARMHAQKKMSY